jgi:hypothetical protein
MQIIPSAVYRVGDRQNIMTSPQAHGEQSRRKRSGLAALSLPACLRA